MANAQAFLTCMEEELKVYSSMTYKVSGASRVLSIKKMDSSFTLDSNQFNADRLYDHARRAFDTWGQLSAFSAGGTGGGEHCYRLNFGSNDTHAFVDLIAHEEDGKTTIECLARVLE